MKILFLLSLLFFNSFAGKTDLCFIDSLDEIVDIDHDLAKSLYNLEVKSFDKKEEKHEAHIDFIINFSLLGNGGIQLSSKLFENELLQNDIVKQLDFFDFSKKDDVKVLVVRSVGIVAHMSPDDFTYDLFTNPNFLEKLNIDTTFSQGKTQSNIIAEREFKVAGFSLARIKTNLHVRYFDFVKGKGNMLKPHLDDIKQLDPSFQDPHKIIFNLIPEESFFSHGAQTLHTIYPAGEGSLFVSYQFVSAKGSRMPSIPFVNIGNKVLEMSKAEMVHYLLQMREWDHKGN